MGKWGDAFSVMRDVVHGQAMWLNLYEQTTLHFIYARTRLYGKEWEQISRRHFLKGVWSSKDGVAFSFGCITPRVKISDFKLNQALKGLREKGIIQVRKAVGSSNSYRIREIDEIGSECFSYAIEHQPDVMWDLYRQMKWRGSQLNGDAKKMLKAMEEHYNEQKAKKAAPSNSISSATATSRVRVTKLPHGSRSK